MMLLFFFYYRHLPAMWRVALRDLFAKWKIYPHLVVSVHLGACVADFGAVFIGLVHVLVEMEMQYFWNKRITISISIKLSKEPWRER